MFESRTSRSNVLGALAAGGIVIAFCLILLWHDPLIFCNDDYQISILPVFADVARSWNEGHFPLLSPYSWVCSNLAGEFQYGTFSVFVNAAVILIWKFPLTFPQQAAALSITHLFVLAMGAFLLAHDRLRIHGEPSPPPSPAGRGGPRPRVPWELGLGGRTQRRRVRETALSIFVALVAALNGWIICWGASDWFGALGAFTWFPWAWWGLERALDLQRTHYRFLWPAPFVYLLVTGGFPYTVVMLLLLVAWLSIKSLAQTKKIISILPMLFGVALGFGLSAPAWLALLDYIQGSARELSNLAHFRWVVPPAALPGFILPCWTVNWVEFSPRLASRTSIELACGLVAPVTLIAGFIWRARVLWSRMKWEILLLMLVLALSMLPTAGLFQWSFRWLPFVHLVLALCAAEVLSITPELPTPATTGLLGLVLIGLAMSIFHVSGTNAFSLTWIYLAVAALWFLSQIARQHIKFRQWLPAIVSFCVLLATYLCLPTNSSVPKFNLDQKLLEPAPLDPQRLYMSIYPSPESAYCVGCKPGPIGQVVRLGSTSMWAGLHFINGYSPIRPAGVAREFSSYVHGEFDPTVGNNLLKEQAGPEGKLALLGVDGITIAREIDVDPQPASEWELVFSNDEGRVFHRRDSPFLSVRSVTALDSQSDEQFSKALISRTDDSRNEVTVDIDVPSGDKAALLIFSRPYFRGYVARLDDKKIPVDSYRGLFPIVKVPPASHGRLVLSYRPAWLIYGSALSIFAAAIFLVALGYSTAARRSAA